MNYKTLIFLSLLLLPGSRVGAQKPFAEGTIVYKVKIESPDHRLVTGTYTFMIKGSQIRKEIKLNNGYQNVEVIDCMARKAYSLPTANGQKYAVELDMDDIVKNQEKFGGFIVKNEESDSRNIAGYAVYKGSVNYKDGSGDEIYYTKEWEPTQTVTFERFPDAKFLPLSFSYKDENNLAMEFVAQKMTPGPIENAVFRIPPECKIISNEDYKALWKR